MPTLINNPIAYSQFQIRGGWKNTLSVALLYMLVLGGAIAFTIRLSQPRTGPAWNGWVVGLLVIESGLLLLFGASRVSAAIRRDITLRMMESHQLMPVGGFTAVIGYLIGAGSQAFVLAMATVLLGVVVASQAGISVSHFIFANVALLELTLFTWFVTAFMAFLMKGGFWLMGGVAFVVLSSNLSLVTILPPLQVIAGLQTVESIFTLRGTATATFIPWAYAVTVLSHAFIAAICLIGAARKYRRGEDSAFGPALGLAMVAGWIALGAVAVSWPESFKINDYMRTPSITDQLVAMTISALLLAIVPLASAAWAHVEWRRHRLEDDPRPMRQPLPIWAVAAGVTLLLLPLLFIADGDASAGTLVNVSTQQIVATLLVVASFCIGMGYLLRWIYLAVPKALLIGGLWLLITWLAPILIDAAIHAAQPDARDSEFKPIFGAISPVGALLQIWGDDGYDFRIGLIVQMVLNTIPVLLNVGKFSVRARV